MQRLQMQLEHVSAQVRAQTEDNESLRQRNLEQERRLLEQELRLQMQVEHQAELWTKQSEQDRNILQHLQSQYRAINSLLLKNCELKEQLAELQGSFRRLVRGRCSLGSSLPGPSGQSIRTPSPPRHNKMGVLWLSLVSQNPAGASAWDREASPSCPALWTPRRGSQVWLCW